MGESIGRSRRRNRWRLCCLRIRRIRYKIRRSRMIRRWKKMLLMFGEDGLFFMVVGKKKERKFEILIYVGISFFVDFR